MRPTRSHFATTAMPPATAPATSSTSAAAKRRPDTTEFDRQRLNAPSTATPIANVTTSGNSRHVSTSARMTFNRRDG